MFPEICFILPNLSNRRIKQSGVLESRQGKPSGQNTPTGGDTPRPARPWHSYGVSPVITTRVWVMPKRWAARLTSLGFGLHSSDVLPAGDCVDQVIDTEGQRGNASTGGPGNPSQNAILHATALYGFK